MSANKTRTSRRPSTGSALNRPHCLKTRARDRDCRLVHFQEKYIYKTQAAQIIGTSGSDQSTLFTIDKGADAEIERDMAVITADGIVGKVREVYPRSAQVLADQ